jgi:putative membrane protein
MFPGKPGNPHDPQALQTTSIPFIHEGKKKKVQSSGRERDVVIDALQSAYPWIKSLHVIAIITWMAGLFYLPRLYVYHVEGWQGAGVVVGSEMDLLYQRQERLLLRAIMNPSMIAAWTFGLALAVIPGVVDWSAGWPWVKLASVLGMTWFHMWCAARRKDLAGGRNRLTGRQYRLMNEVPTVLMLAIVVSVIARPF